MPQVLGERRLMSAIHRIPGYVKVNVYMPNDFQNLYQNDNSFSNDYATKFWYPGWYFLHSITHTFSDGEFRQEMQMFSIPVNETQEKMKGNEDCTKGNTTNSAASENVGATTSIAELETTQSTTEPTTVCRQTRRGKRCETASGVVGTGKPPADSNVPESTGAEKAAARGTGVKIKQKSSSATPKRTLSRRNNKQKILDKKAEYLANNPSDEGDVAP
jgi:hypothetical protein